MKRKIYRLLSSAKQGMFALALTVFSGTAYSQTTYTFNYTGGVQTLNVQAGNTYTIEIWGADGGDNLGNGSTTFLQSGGKGGYSRGTYSVTSAGTIYVNVGGRGGNSTSAINTTVSGGYNGGGYGSANATAGKSSGAGGGGATHVATATGLLSALVGSQSSVLIVAGGGGGAGESNYVNSSTQYNSNGGNGGGTSGLQDPATGYQGRHGQGGTQVAGGGGGDNGSAVAGVPLQGIFGAGGYNPTAGANTLVGGSGAGGGGGGWYGGGAGWVATGTSYMAGSGGGGSGYIGGVTNGTTIVSGLTGFVTNPATTGDGLVIIKESCNISLSTTGTGANGAVCAGSSVTLTTNGISNYLWSNGATTSSIVVSPSSNTVYSLTATSPSNCTAGAAITITVNGAIPSLTVTNTANSGGVCPNSTVNLNATGALSYTWTGGSPTVTNGVTFMPIAPYDYTVRGSNGCGTSSAVTSVSVHPFPTINTTVSSPTLCSGNTLTLTATGNATNYAWSGAATTITNGVGFVPTTSSTFVVIGTSALSCTALASVPVTVYITPTIAPVASPTIVCLGGSTTLTAVGALSYTWSSQAQTVNTNTFLVTPGLGTAIYTVTKANSNCAHTSTISVTTNSLPSIAAFANPSTACALSPVTLAAGGAQTYTWTAPGTPNYTFTGSSNVISAPVSTTYTVAASDGTCVSISTVSLNIDPNPTITISTSTNSICDGQQVTMTASGGNSYTWTVGSTILTGASITQAPNTSTSYNVIGDNNFGCTSQASQIIFVYNSPVITVSANKNLICSGTPVTFSASGANTYTWDPSANSTMATSVTVNPVRSSSGFVTYSVQGTNTVGCIGSGTAQVNIYVPVLSVSGNTNACKGSAVNLTANGGNSGSYSWDTGSGTPISGQGIITTVSAPAIYTVSANTTSLSLTCPATQTAAVGLFPDANIVATAQRTTICTNESVELYASGGVSYSWNTTSTSPTIVVKPLIQTTYTVTGIDHNGCQGTGTVQVKLSSCVGIAERNSSNTGLVIYPNPNNGQFTISSSSDVNLILVNELGQLVQSIELSEGNNRSVQVKDLSQGIYFITGKNSTAHINQKIVITD